MPLNKGKCWYSNNCVHFLKRIFHCASLLGLAPSLAHKYDNWLEEKLPKVTTLLSSFVKESSMYNKMMFLVVNQLVTEDTKAIHTIITTN